MTLKLLKSTKKKKGIFITFEGIDGSGKTTQALILTHRLRDLGHEVVLVRDPGSTEVGELIRQILKNPLLKMDDFTELCLYTAARAQLTSEVIMPALQQGKTVISDRFIDSTVAYQGAGKGISRVLINTLMVKTLPISDPDLTIITDLHVITALSRIKDPDCIEQNGIEFFNRVRACYLRLAIANPSRFAVFDGLSIGISNQRSIENLSDSIYDFVYSKYFTT